MVAFEHLRRLLMRSSRAFVWSATMFGLTILLSFVAVIDYAFYRAALESRQQAGANVATLIERDVTRNIELYDLSVKAVIDGLNDPEVMALEPRMRQKALFDTSVTAHGLGALVVLDRNGTIVQDSRSTPPRPGNFADREYFTVHRDSPRDIGLYLSRPFQARLQNSVWSMSVSRRLSAPDGSFQGIVSGTMRLDYFDSLFNSIARSGSITLLRTDGTVIVPQRGGESDVAPALSFALPDRQHGSLVDVQSIRTFRRFADLPLIVLVEQSKDEVLSGWRSRNLMLLGVFATMASSVVVLVWLLDGELRRRAAAEAVAAELARSDGLTGLANRRSFEEALGREWSRAERDGLPISLVLLDADYFKPFNDSYGHQQGDAVLRAIAGVIARAARRPSDLGARYGGEEFALLLPGTDAVGAMQVSAAIRDEVAALNIQHGGSGHGIVTVSVGVTTFFPRPGLSAKMMVAHADAALYRAKMEGRNTVRQDNVVPVPSSHALDRAS